MKICLIGGGGFIGTNTARHLRHLGHDVWVADIVRVNHNSWQYCDVTDKTHVEDLLHSSWQWDVVYYFASVIRAEDCRQNPEHARRVNIDGLTNVLNCLRHTKTRIVYSSTVHVYTDPSPDPLTEDAKIDCNVPGHIYPITKLIGEMLIRSYNFLYGIPYTITRYGIVYGEGGHEDLAVHAFIKNGLNEKPLRVEGGGVAKRNFVYIQDIVKGNAALLCDEAVNQTINLCSDQSVSIRDVAMLVSNYIGNCDLQITAGRVGDHSEVQISNQKAKELLGWKPEYDFKDTVHKLIDQKSFM